MREYLAHALVVGLSAAFLVPFYRIATEGRYSVGEDNPVVLALEISLLAGIAVYGIVNLARILRRL